MVLRRMPPVAERAGRLLAREAGESPDWRESFRRVIPAPPPESVWCRPGSLDSAVCSWRAVCDWPCGPFDIANVELAPTAATVSRRRAASWCAFLSGPVQVAGTVAAKAAACGQYAVLPFVVAAAANPVGFSPCAHAGDHRMATILSLRQSCFQYPRLCPVERISRIWPDMIGSNRMDLLRSASLLPQCLGAIVADLVRRSTRSVSTENGKSDDEWAQGRGSLRMGGRPAPHDPVSR